MQLTELEAHRHSIATRSGEISYIDIEPEDPTRRTGPVALFVHGIATNAFLWRNDFGALSTQRRCIVVGLPLHGRSPVTAGQDLSVAALAAGLEDFCDALGLTGIDLVANDTGGAIAQIFAARHPERLATLTLTDCDTAGNLPPAEFKPDGRLARAGTWRRPRWRCSPTSTRPPRSRPSAPATSTWTGSTRRLSAPTWNPASGRWSAPGSSKGCWLALDEADLAAVTPQLRELTVPTLLVWGTGDSFFDVSWAYWLRDTIPGTTEVVTVEGARLFFPDERAMDLVPHLEQHWAAAAVRA